VFNHEAT
jgi:kinesin family member C1